MTEKIEVLRDNYKCEEGTIIYFLHEEASWDEEAMKKYLSSIYELSQEPKEEINFNEISMMIVKTYGYILSSLLYHHHKNDGYEISNYPEESLVAEYVETMRVIVDDCFFKGVKLDKTHLDVEL